MGKRWDMLDLFGNALRLSRRAASAADDLRMARGCRWRSLVVVDSVPVEKRWCDVLEVALCRLGVFCAAASGGGGGSAIREH